MTTYAILVREKHPGAALVELCRCSSNPEALRQAAQKKTIALKVNGRTYREPRYAHVEILEIKP